MRNAARLRRCSCRRFCRNLAAGNGRSRFRRRGLRSGSRSDQLDREHARDPDLDHQRRLRSAPVHDGVPRRRERRHAAPLHSAGADAPVAAGRTSILGGVSTPGKSGLLEINASTAMSIDARLFSTSADALSSSVSPVPLISSDNLFDAGKTAVVLGLRRDPAQGDITGLGVVNLGKQAAQCVSQVLPRRRLADRRPGDIDLQGAFAALFQRRLQPARRAAGGRRARGGELQPAVLYLRDAVQPDQLADPLHHPLRLGRLDAERTGRHQCSRRLRPPARSSTPSPACSTPPRPATRRRRIKIELAKAMPARRMVLDMDFVPGPWNRAKSPGQPRDRSGSIAPSSAATRSPT